MRSDLIASSAALLVRGGVVAVATGLLILALSQSAYAQGTTVIPPPPPIHEPEATTNHQAQQDDNDPARAFDPTTGQNMHWDPVQKTWKDSKTGRPVPGGFKGRRGKADCPPPPKCECSCADIDRYNSGMFTGDKESVACVKSCAVKDAKEKKCPPPISVESVNNLIGNNPFNPQNPLGGGQVTTLTPGCKGPQPASESQTLLCPGGQTGTLIQTRPYACVGSIWVPGVWQTVSITCTAPPSSCLKSGTFLGCNGGCQVGGSLTINVTGSTLTATPFGANGTTSFNVNGCSATSASNNLIMFGKPGHTCTLNSTGMISCWNNSGRSCNESCTAP